MAAPDPDEWLTVEEIANEYKISLGTVRDWIHSGELPHRNVGTQARKNYRVRRADLDTFLDARTAETIEYRKKLQG